MPLLDHFHPPVSQRRSWEGLHGLWTAALVEYLNGGVLANEFYADMQIHVGGAVEVDVATLTESPPPGLGNGAATATTIVMRVRMRPDRGSGGAARAKSATSAVAAHTAG